VCERSAPLSEVRGHDFDRRRRGRIGGLGHGRRFRHRGLEPHPTRGIALDGHPAGPVVCRAMRLVLDTNVIVSALLNAGRTPDRAIASIRARGDLLLYDSRIAEEYRSVLARPKFMTIDPLQADALIAALFRQGQDLGEVAPWDGPLIDPRDRCFVQVALAGRADAIVTGNTRHYPLDLGFDVLDPAAFLARCAKGG
jgi:uncharacterized protein